MTPTRLQLVTMLHGPLGGPRAMFTHEKGDKWRREQLEGLDGWLIVDARGKSFWVPLSAVAGMDVDITPGLETVAKGALASTPGIAAWLPEPGVRLDLCCAGCGQAFKTSAALASHRRAKHPEASP